MSDDDVYLFLVDDVWKEIEKLNPKNIEEVSKIVDKICERITDKIGDALYDIQNDYCEEKGLEYEDEL